MKYAWIEQHRPIYSTTTIMCELLSVSRSGLYEARGRKPSSRLKQEACVLEQIRASQRQHKGRSVPQRRDDQRGGDGRARGKCSPKETPASHRALKY